MLTTNFNIIITISLLVAAVCMYVPSSVDKLTFLLKFFIIIIKGIEI